MFVATGEAPLRTRGNAPLCIHGTMHIRAFPGGVNSVVVKFGNRHLLAYAPLRGSMSAVYCFRSSARTICKI